jgi:hypothetical protein
VSHPIPLHPDADLAVVLDDMRQSVAAWGDEGMVMRFFRASICLMLLSILDTLIELLADFRAGRLPPVLPAQDESETPAPSAMRDRRTDPPPTPAGPAAAFPNAAASRPIRAPRDACSNDDDDALADVPEQSAAQHRARWATPAPRRSAFTVSPPCRSIRRPAHGPRGLAMHPSAVPRSPAEKFGRWSTISSHVYFVAQS